MRLKDFHRAECEHLRLLSTAIVENGVANGCVANVGMRMDAIALQVVGVDDLLYGGECGGAFVRAPGCLSGSLDVFPARDDLPDSISSPVLSFPDLVETDSLAHMEPDILASFALHATVSNSLHS